MALAKNGLCLVILVIKRQKNVKRTLINCVKIGVKVLTVYVFSTENWKRPNNEVSFLLTFLKKR